MIINKKNKICVFLQQLDANKKKKKEPSRDIKIAILQTWTLREKVPPPTIEEVLNKKRKIEEIAEI